MVRVFIDLEMNMVSQKHAQLRGALPHEIIEIGAVRMDDACRVVDRFRCYVRPRYNNTVHWGVARLTGITFKTLQNAPYLAEALDMFCDWLSDAQQVLLYAWSDSDRAQWERELTHKDLWTPRLREICAHWTDFQRSFSQMIGYRNALSLARAVEYMGLDFDGAQHDALSDAENCARVMAVTLDEAAFAARKALIPPEPQPAKPVRAEAENGAGDQKETGSATARRRRRHRHKKRSPQTSAGVTPQDGPFAQTAAAPEETAAGAGAAQPAARRRRHRRRTRRAAVKAAE